MPKSRNISAPFQIIASASVKYFNTEFFWYRYCIRRVFVNHVLLTLLKACENSMNICSRYLYGEPFSLCTFSKASCFILA